MEGIPMRTLSGTDELTKMHGDWRQQSRCHDEPPEDFFPIGHGPTARRQAERAKRLCAECQVREPCLVYALENGISDGVFGGLDEVERRTLGRGRVAG
jgi:WhiB family redox-sensing transcriptional regulator